MKIKSIKTFAIDCFRTNWVFVKVETDDGIHGVGEGTLEYKENALLGAIADLEHALVGKDPFDTEWIFHENYRDAYWRGGPVLMSALSAIVMALWDIKGKALGLPVWKLIGGKCREGVPCYANCWFAGAKEPEECCGQGGDGGQGGNPHRVPWTLRRADSATDMQRARGVFAVLGRGTGHSRHDACACGRALARARSNRLRRTALHYAADT